MSDSLHIQLEYRTLADQLRTACILECTAPKPGNVFPGFSFADVTYADFVASADVIAPILAESSQIGVGKAIRNAVVATRAKVGTNTNLGMLLLLAPLAAVPLGSRCSEGIESVLQALDLQQTRLIYEAIRLAQPGGLGQVSTNDVADEPTISILAAMAQTPHDRVAWQYTHAFDDVLRFGRDRFLSSINAGADWSMAIVRVHLEFIARQSDSLIHRKCGSAIAEDAQRRAQDVIAKWRTPASIPEETRQFDAWLRADGHRRNPGTTADLLAAVLFAAIRDGDWKPPEQISLNV